LCRPDRKIIAEASLRDRKIDTPDAAARPFVDQGVVAMSLDRVSDQIGLAGSAIYCYYRSKPDLFLAIYRRDGISRARNTPSSRERSEGA
jgi:AcrR family transcriptional regulator